MSRIVSGTENFNNGGYLIPTKEVGNDVFDILEEFMERISNHRHDGDDSHEISLNIEKDQEIFTTGINLLWTSVYDGYYRAQLQVPPATTYDNSIRKFFYERSAGVFEEFYPTIERIDNGSYYLYSNDNVSNIKVVTL